MAEPLELRGAAPSLYRVLALRVDIGPGLLLGESVDGTRCNYPILGGDFEGLDFKGQVLAGGEDFSCCALTASVNWTHATACVPTRGS